MSRCKTSSRSRHHAAQTRSGRTVEVASRAGFTFVPVLAMIVVLFAVGSSTIVTTMKHMDRVSLNERSIQALEIAEKGVAQAMYELTRKTDLDQTSGIGNVAGAFAGGLFQCAATTRPDNRFLLRSRGTFKGVVREIAVLVAGSSGSWAAQGIAARGNLEVTGQFNVDSYDSSAGTYASQAVNESSGDTYANSDAKLSSNASIDAGPNAVVRGDLRPGPDGVLTIHRRTFISGSTDALDEPFPLPDPPVEAFRDAYDNNMNGTWSVSGKVNYNESDRSLSLQAHSTLTLQPGVYFFSSISVAGGATIVVSDKTTIFVVGDIKFSGGSVTNETRRPKDFEIIAHPYAIPSSYTPPENPEFKLSGGAATSMVLYAPAYSVFISGQAEIQGAVVGDNVTLKCVDFHFDESLIQENDLQPVGSNGIATYSRVAWIEPNQPGY